MSKDDKSTRCLGKINELSPYVHYYTDRSGRILPARRGKSEGNASLLRINHLSYVWYVLVLYTNTSWSSVCHKYFPIQISARTCSISLILSSHFSEIGLEDSRKIQELKAHFNSVSQSCSHADWRPGKITEVHSCLTFARMYHSQLRFPFVWENEKDWPVMRAFPRSRTQVLRVLYTHFFPRVSESGIWCLERFEDL